MMSQRDYQARQRQPFDAKILILKLEALQRDLDRAQGRWDRRDVHRKGVFVPQTAASHFATTATPRTKDHTTHILQFDHPPPMPSIPHDLKAKRSSQSVSRDLSEKRSSINPKQFYAALSVGMSESEAVAAVTHVNETWHAPRESHNATRRATSAKRVSRLPRTRAEGNDADAVATRPQTAREAKRCSYRPGDAQKRRAESDMAPSSNLPFYVSSILDIDQDMGSSSQHRLQQARQDRPNWSNWAQDAQDEDAMRDTLPVSRLHFWTKPDSALKVPGGDEMDARRSRSDCRGHTRPQWSTDSDSDHMISDAVKEIKKQERVHRRKSIMAFFRRAS